MPDAPVYLSTRCLRDLPLEEALRWCRENGIFHVELSGPHPFEPIEKIRSLLMSYRKKGLSFTIHNYFPPQGDDFILNIASPDKDIYLKSVRLVEEALKLCDEVGSPVYGVHSGYLGDGKAGPDGTFIFTSFKEAPGACLQRAVQFIESAVKKIPNNRISLILENLFPESSKSYSLARTIEEIKEMMVLLPECVGLLLDLGHLSVASRMLKFDKFLFLEEYLSAFGNRVFEVHLSENSGLADEHLILSKASWQLKALPRINSVPTKKAFPRVFCLEAKDSRETGLLKSSMELIQDSLS